MLGVAWFGVIRLLSPQWSVYEQYQYGWAVPFLCLYLLFLRWQDRPWAGVGTSPKAESRELAGITLVAEVEGGSEGGRSATRPTGETAARGDARPSEKDEGQKSEVRSQRTEDGGKRSEISGRGAEASQREMARSGVRRPTMDGRGLAPLLCLVVVGLLLLPTRIIVEANLIWRAASWAMVGQMVLITLVVILLAGGKPWLKHFGFAVAFFLVAVPWPSQWENALVQSLMRLNTGIVVELISVMGIPALQHGNVIEVSAGMVGVDEACSGIRSLQATFMIALFFGEYYRLRVSRRLGLVAAGAGLAMVCNIARTFTLVYVSSKSGMAAMEKWHDPTGIAILLACFCGLWWVAVKMKPQKSTKDARGEKDSKFKIQNSKWETGPRMDTEGHGLEGCHERHEAHETGAGGDKGEKQKTEMLKVENGGGKEECGGRKAEGGRQEAVVSSQQIEGGGRSVPRGVVVGLAIWLGLVEVVNALWFGLRDQQRTDVQNWTVRWPEEKPGFRKVEFSGRVLSQLQSQRQDSAAWQGEDGSVWQAFHLQWGPATNLQQRVKVLLARTHRPEHCLPGSGKELVEFRGNQEFRIDSLKLPFRAFQFSDNGRPLFVYFCIWEDGVTGTAAELRADNSSRLRVAWVGHRSAGQRVLELAVWGKATAAEADLEAGAVIKQIISRTVPDQQLRNGTLMNATP